MVIFSIFISTILLSPHQHIIHHQHAKNKLSILELSDSQLNSRIEAYLGSFCIPVKKAQWQSLGQRAIPILETIVQNDTALPSRRTAALAGLTALNSTSSTTTIHTLANNTNEHVSLRFAALRSLAALTQQDKLESTLKPFMISAHDARIRAVAAEQLSIHSKGSKCSLVRQQLARENPKLRRIFARAALICGDP
ncbi:MAG: hypothetical protein JW841_17200 [Deltaproteobacteria bacterium]|nr:hypothetical protein [Deltaproteobacteria bacterium]